jgi:hypothetical protein
MVEMDTEVFKWAIPVVFRFAIGYWSDKEEANVFVI